MDYILQALRNNGVKEAQYAIHNYLERSGDQFQMLAEISVDFYDFKVCQNLCNFLVEKLDENVLISRPVFHHSHGKLDAARYWGIPCYQFLPCFHSVDSAITSKPCSSTDHHCFCLFFM